MTDTGLRDRVAAAIHRQVEPYSLSDCRVCKATADAVLAELERQEIRDDRGEVMCWRYVSEWLGLDIC